MTGDDDHSEPQQAPVQPPGRCEGLENCSRNLAFDKPLNHGLMEIGIGGLAERVLALDPIALEQGGETALNFDQARANADDIPRVIGRGGPAGLTAAVYLGRFRRRVLLVDGGWSRAEWITQDHNIAGFPQGIAGQTLSGFAWRTR